MWSFISSIFGSKIDPEELSLEDACDVLKTEEVNEEKNDTDNKHQTFNTLSTRIGMITQKSNKKYIIDNIYVFDKNEYSLELGSKVQFDIILSEGKEKILNVKLIESDWDVSQLETSLWNDRVIIGKVEKRVERKLYISPGDLVLDLNNTSLEFLPVVGDWLELFVKCAVDEHILNLSGKVIEVDKVLPVRPHVESGKISSWKNDTGTGVINRNVYFNKESLSCGYIPVVGDRIIAEIIESEQDNCAWRALKVIPEYMKAKSTNSPASLQLPEFKDDYPGLEISGLSLCFEKLNLTKEFTISLSVTSDEVFSLMNVEFLDSNSQCKILTVLEKDTVISKDKICVIGCQYTSKNMGSSKEFVLFTFDKFSVGKWLNVNVMLNHNSTNGFYERQYKPRVTAYEGNYVVRNKAGPRFRAIQIPEYPVPKKLVEQISKYEYRDMAILLEELKITKPVLFSNLSFINYEDRFHTLLHLDEIANAIALQNYDEEKVCFIPNADLLMLEVENLSERRPSIVIGDKIIATDPLNANNTDFEGLVQKVGAKHVYIKFSHLFHDQYNGEDYSIRVVPSRNSYRRQHHAIYLASRNIGADLLFPSKLSLRDVQVEFECPNVDFNKIFGVNQPEQPKNSDTVMKLEWYNKKLNHPQQNAVKNILKGEARPLPYIIFGPPGTGKTVTIIETILQIVRLIPQSRLLITAPSNSAADLIACRLIDSGVIKPGDLIRLVSHNYAMSESIPTKLVPYCAAGGMGKEGTTGGPIWLNGILTECNKSLVGRHRLTVSTCSTAGQLFYMGFSKGHFSHIIVDEAAQAAETEVMIPITFLDKASGQVILAGDPMQLGPVVLSNLSEQLGLSESYIERIMNRFPYVRDPECFQNSYGYDPRLVTKLVYNYRSLPDILGLYSSLFYNNELIATIDSVTSKEAQLANSVAEILPKTTSGQVPHLVFHGVEGENFQTPDSPSWFNPHEAAQVFYYINELYRLGLGAQNIGIITPYTKQVKEIRSVLTEAEFDIPKIGSVEEFQGQEFDVIILSTVRSSNEYVSFDISHSLGFVTSPKRLNVAISRAKSLLIIIGNPHLLCCDTYWRSVVTYCLEKGSYTGCELSV